MAFIFLQISSVLGEDIPSAWSKGGISAGPPDYISGPDAEVVDLTPYDRVGFIRFRKVGSTSLHFFLMADKFCYRDCKITTCLYAFHDCSIKFPCPPSLEGGYACGHFKGVEIVSKFELELEQWRNLYQHNPLERDLIRKARLFLVCLVRDPVDRLLSEFFFVQLPENRKEWRVLFNDETWKTIEDNDFEAFLKARGNMAVHRQTLQLAGTEYFEGQVSIDKAMKWLHVCKAVLVQDYMPQGLVLLHHTFRRTQPLPSYNLGRVARKSKPTVARKAVEDNPRLMKMARDAVWADIMVYEEAKRLFFKSMRRMAQEHGYAVTNDTRIEDILQQYHVDQQIDALSFVGGGGPLPVRRPGGGFVFQSPQQGVQRPEVQHTPFPLQGLGAQPQVVPIAIPMGNTATNAYPQIKKKARTNIYT